MDISKQNYFELFSLQPALRLEDAELNNRYQALQARYHPDQYSSADSSERLRALQFSSIVNEAYNTLKSPLRRAAYLLSLQGMDPESHDQSALDSEFLLQQMAWRDQLEDLASQEDMDGLDELKGDVKKDKQEDWQSFADCYEKKDYRQAKLVYHRLQFIEKLLHEIDQVEEKLLDY